MSNFFCGPPFGKSRVPHTNTVTGRPDEVKTSLDNPHTMDRWFDKAAFALTKPNELSPVVESPFGYHVIQLVEKQDASVAPFDMVKAQIEEFLKQKQSQQVLAAHVQELRSKGKVETFL